MKSSERLNLNHELGSWIKQTGSLIDTHTHQEVAEAKLTTKQNSSAFWWLLLAYIGGRAARGCWGRNPNSKWAPSGLDEVQVTQPMSGSLTVILTINLSSGWIWWWGLIHLKGRLQELLNEYSFTSIHLSKWRVTLDGNFCCVGGPKRDEQLRPLLLYFCYAKGPKRNEEVHPPLLHCCYTKGRKRNEQLCLLRKWCRDRIQSMQMPFPSYPLHHS